MSTEDFDLDKELAEEWRENEEFTKLYADYWVTKEPEFKPARSGVAFALRPPNPIKAYVDGFLYPGVISAIIGPPKSGKSTFVWTMLADLVQKKPFMGTPTTLPGSVLYVTEQGAMSFDEQLRGMPCDLRERILMSGRFFIMLPEDHITTTVMGTETAVTEWKDRVKLWKTAIEKTKAQVFVLDTFGQYADLGANGENDNSIISKRIFELRELTKANPTLSVLLLSHSNKGSKGKQYLSLMDSRGGNAYAGGLDHGVTFNKAGDSGGTERYVHIESRMTKEEQFMVKRDVLSGVYIRTAGDPLVDQITLDPALADLGIRPLAEALEKLVGYKVSYRAARAAKNRYMGGDDEMPEVSGPIPGSKVSPTESDE